MKHDIKLNAKELQTFLDSKEIEVASTTHLGNRLRLIRLVSTPTYKVMHGDDTLVTTPSLNHAIKVFENA